MADFAPAAVLLGVVVAGIGAVYALHLLVAAAARPLPVLPYLGGSVPGEQAPSRYHARWYAVTLLFLAFDIEMIFMYPWTLVVADVGASAVIEMFSFLGLITLGVLYAWREGALRWA